MAQSARETLQPEVPARARRDAIIRPPELRRDFPVREAQRHLREKERHWAPIAYAVFLVAAVVIFFGTYTSYAFSKYRSVILPGVTVDNVSLGGMSEQQAERVLYGELQAIYYKPVRITYHAYSWDPKNTDLGVRYLVPDTVSLAYSVGRRGGFLRDLVDRLPLHPSHSVPLLYQLDRPTLTSYLRTIGSKVYKPEKDAALQSESDNHIHLIPSERGLQIDVPHSVHAIESSLGFLSPQVVTLQVRHIEPVIGDLAAIRVRDRVEAFLSKPPIIRIGKLRIVTSRSDFAPMLHFAETRRKTGATIQMNVAEGDLHQYVTRLASQIDRPASNAKLDYSAGKVQVILPRRTGRTLDQATAFSSLAAAITSLKPGAHLRFPVRVVQPPTDLSNPASVGINRLLASGTTSFTGSPAERLNDITLIAQQLDGDLLPPGQDVSFNALAGQAWDPRVYQDEEMKSGGRLVPGAGGAMQQVATTFLRALYSAGLQVKERHAHTHRLGWYEPPVGLDAVVAPDRGWDLVFHNNTGKYLLIKARVEPVRQQLYIYVYGPKLGWRVVVDPAGKVLKVYPHGKTITKNDPSLPPGAVQQTQWAHDGADTSVQRTITYPNGNVAKDQITSHYQPWHGIILVGASASATPTPTKGKHGQSGPGAQPTPTYSH